MDIHTVNRRQSKAIRHIVTILLDSRMKPEERLDLISHVVRNLFEDSLTEEYEANDNRIKCQLKPGGIYPVCCPNGKPNEDCIKHARN